MMVPALSLIPWAPLKTTEAINDDYGRVLKPGTTYLLPGPTQVMFDYFGLDQLNRAMLLTQEEVGIGKDLPAIRKQAAESWAKWFYTGFKGASLVTGFPGYTVSAGATLRQEEPRMGVQVKSVPK